MQTSFSRERVLLGGLFFLQAHAIALWFVPFSSILQSRNMGWMVPWAFGSSALAALVSPMLTGTLADKHVSPTTLLRTLSLSIATCLCLTFFAIEHEWPPGWILACIQIQHLCSAPAWGLTSQLVLAALPDPGRQFGPLRAWATYGWMVACLLVSWIISGDNSTRSGFWAAAVWILVAVFTIFIKSPAPRPQAAKRGVRDIWGLEAFRILRNREHRGVFLSAGLLSIPLAAFYPYAPLHLQGFEVTRTSAWMALGQVSEVLSMYALAPLLAVLHLRTLFLIGISASVLRYILFATDSLPGLICGIFLHGICFTFFFIPAQIYIEQRIDAALRYRAQALLTLLINGVGNLFGYLGCGWLHFHFINASNSRWIAYWGCLAACVAIVGVYFWKTYPLPITAPQSPKNRDFEEKAFDSSPV